MHYVTYNLDWNGSIGEQPYTDLTGLGVTFEGGVIVKNDINTSNRVYFGYMDGPADSVRTAITACDVNFSMTELTQEETLAFFLEVVPQNTQRYDINGDIKYTGIPIVGEDSKISIPLSDTQWI